MKQSGTNSFTGGLNYDVSPIIAPNNVLTDCINGTIITYNGNEYMLQNDMGNYKLANSNIPFGYIPLGIKEYNSIMYIVSYNPIDKRTEIGTFPSPEYNAATNDTEISRDFTYILLDEKYQVYETFVAASNLEVISSTDNFFLNPGDQYKIGVNLDAFDTNLQEFELYILSSNKSITKLSSSAYQIFDVNEEVPEESEFVLKDHIDMTWGTPGWIAYKVRIFTINSFDLYFQSATNDNVLADVKLTTYPDISFYYLMRSLDDILKNGDYTTNKFKVLVNMVISASIYDNDTDSYSEVTYYYDADNFTPWTDSSSDVYGLDTPGFITKDEWIESRESDNLSIEDSDWFEYLLSIGQSFDLTKQNSDSAYGEFLSATIKTDNVNNNKIHIPNVVSDFDNGDIYEIKIISKLYYEKVNDGENSYLHCSNYDSVINTGLTNIGTSSYTYVNNFYWNVDDDAIKVEFNSIYDFSVDEEESDEESEEEENVGYIPFSTSYSDTSTTTHHITSIDDLELLATNVNAGNSYDGYTFEVVNDLDFQYISGYDDDGAPVYTVIEHTSIGNSINTFNGTFDGGGHTISNLSIDSSSDYQGLFGYVSGGAISNLIVKDANVKGAYYVGAVCGRLYGSGTIENCGVEGGSVSGSVNYVGGVVGRTSSAATSVTSCYNTGSVSGSGNFVGGVVGLAYSSVTSCYNTGSVSGSSYVGGVVGYAASSSVTSCYNTGDVSGGGSHVGGVVGYAASSVTSCYNTGSVSGSGVYVGGVVGCADSFISVTSCYNTGSVSGSGNYVGGVVGRAYSSVTSCYNTGSVSGSSYVGGVVGCVDGSTIRYCSNSSVSISTSCGIAGLPSSAGGDIYYCIEQTESNYLCGKFTSISNCSWRKDSGPYASLSSDPEDWPSDVTDCQILTNLDWYITTQSILNLYLYDTYFSDSGFTMDSQYWFAWHVNTDKTKVELTNNYVPNPDGTSSEVLTYQNNDYTLINSFTCNLYSLFIKENNQIIASSIKNSWANKLQLDYTGELNNTITISFDDNVKQNEIYLLELVFTMNISDSSDETSTYDTKLYKLINTSTLFNNIDTTLYKKFDKLYAENWLTNLDYTSISSNTTVETSITTSYVNNNVWTSNNNDDYYNDFELTSTESHTDENFTYNLTNNHSFTPTVSITTDSDNQGIYEGLVFSINDIQDIVTNDIDYTMVDTGEYSVFTITPKTNTNISLIDNQFTIEITDEYTVPLTQTTLNKPIISHVKNDTQYFNTINICENNSRTALDGSDVIDIGDIIDISITKNDDNITLTFTADPIEEVTNTYGIDTVYNADGYKCLQITHNSIENNIAPNVNNIIFYKFLDTTNDLIQLQNVYGTDNISLVYPENIKNIQNINICSIKQSFSINDVIYNSCYALSIISKNDNEYVNILLPIIIDDKMLTVTTSNLNTTISYLNQLCNHIFVNKNNNYETEDSYFYNLSGTNTKGLCYYNNTVSVTINKIELTDINLWNTPLSRLESIMIDGNIYLDGATFVSDLNINNLILSEDALIELEVTDKTIDVTLDISDIFPTDEIIALSNNLVTFKSNADKCKDDLETFYSDINSSKEIHHDLRSFSTTVNNKISDDEIERYDNFVNVLSYSDEGILLNNVSVNNVTLMDGEDKLGNITYTNSDSTLMPIYNKDLETKPSELYIS